MTNVRSQIQVKRINAPKAWLADNYYRLLAMRWRYLISLSFLGYLVINLIFGILYYIFRDGLHPGPLDFVDCYFFSVHTFSTVGYGAVAPASLVVNIITVVETFVGLTAVALMTGMFFSKFSRPSANFTFTRNILVTKYMGKNVLQFRVANARSNQVMDAVISLNALYDDKTDEGIYYRRIVDLNLIRAHTPVFALSITSNHIIEPGSIAEELLRRIQNKENVEFMVSVRGLDNTLGQTIYATYNYCAENVRWGGQFADILSFDPRSNARTIDFHFFHKVLDK